MPIVTVPLGLITCPWAFFPSQVIFNTSPDKAVTVGGESIRLNVRSKVGNLFSLKKLKVISVGPPSSPQSGNLRYMSKVLGNVLYPSTLARPPGENLKESAVE